MKMMLAKKTALTLRAYIYTANKVNLQSKGKSETDFPLCGNTDKARSFSFRQHGFSFSITFILAMYLLPTL